MTAAPSTTIAFPGKAALLRSPQAVTVIGIGLLALVLRLCLIADLTSIPESDEIGYMVDGFLLIEGLTPGYKHVPGAAITWLAALWTGFQTLGTWLFVDQPSVPALLKPVMALERVLFETYADLDGLRRLVVTLQTLLGSLAAAALTWRGHRLAGLRGALAAGLMAACLPLFVQFAAQTRAYSFAWSFGLLAFAAVCSPRRGWRLVGGGILAGLAIATRLEMVLLLPLLALEAGRAAAPGRRLGDGTRLVAIVLLCFFLAAPWYVTSLIGNLRQILDVRFLVVAAAAAPLGVLRGMLAAGLGVPLGATIVLLAAGAAVRRSWPYGFSALWLALLAAMALRQSGGGMRHDGALFVLTVALAPVALSLLLGAPSRAQPASGRPFRGGPLLASMAAAVFGLGAVAAGIASVWDYRQDAVHDQAVSWLEANVPAGTAVYLSDEGFTVPLPTEAAADALWTEAARADAWRLKFARAAQRLSFERSSPPRALSEDPVQLERALRRRWFMLGAPLAPGRPRYDLRLVGAGSAFSLQPLAVAAQLCREGGAFLFSGLDATAGQLLGAPTRLWRSPSGRRTVALYVVPPPGPGSARRC